MEEKYILLMAWHMQLVTGGDCNTGPQEIPVGHSTAVHCAGENDELTLECYQNMVNCDKDFRLYPIGT